MEGEIIESLRNRMFRVRLDNGHELLGYTAGRLKRYRIRMLLGDRVRIGSAVRPRPRANCLPPPVAPTQDPRSPSARRSCTPLSASVTSLRMSENESTAQPATPSLSSW